MSTLFSDNFNRADSGSLGANWADYFMTATIASNEAVITSGGGDRNPTECVNSAVGSSGSILNAKATITLKGPFTGSQVGGLTGRRAPASDSYYVWLLYADGGWDLTRKLAGYTFLATDGGSKLTLADTSPARMEISGSGATVTIDLYYNGSLVTSYADTDTDRITVAGYYGFLSVADNKHFDNWQIEDFASAATSMPGLRRPRRFFTRPF